MKEAFAAPLLVAGLLIPLGFVAAQTPGDPGESMGPAANAGAPKPDESPKNAFISSGTAYELARNKLLIEAGELTLQIRLATDGEKLKELKTRYDGVLDELEEFGVGPQDETLEDPTRYFDKYDAALKRFEDRGHPATVHASEASPGSQAATLLAHLQVHLTALYVALLGLSLTILELFT